MKNDKNNFEMIKDLKRMNALVERLNVLMRRSLEGSCTHTKAA